MHNGCNDAANKTEDPPGTFRDSNGKLRNSDGTFANDPSAVKKTKTGEEYQRNMSERQKALLRDADDPHADLSDEAREFIKENNGKKYPKTMRFLMKSHFIQEAHMKVKLKLMLQRI